MLIISTSHLASVFAFRFACIVKKCKKVCCIINFIHTFAIVKFSLFIVFLWHYKYVKLVTFANIGQIIADIVIQ